MSKTETSATMVAVIGAGTADETLYEAARDVGRRLARARCTVVTGGLGGVMEAASRGASEAGGQTIGLLPGTDRADANRWVTFALPTGLGDARNALVATAGRGVIAVGGAAGTLSEIGLALKRGLPVVSLGSWDLDRSRLGATERFVTADGPESAVALLLGEIEP